MLQVRILAVLAALLFLAGQAAAYTANSIITPQSAARGGAQFIQGSDAAGTYKTVYTAGPSGSKCYALWSTNNDASVAHLITVQIANGANKFGGMSTNTTANQGFANAVPPLNLMTSTLWPGLPLDSDGNPYIILSSGDTLIATFASALTAGSQINIVANCSDY